MITNKAKIDDDKMSEIFYAALSNNINNLDALLKTNHIETRDEFGRTALNALCGLIELDEADLVKESGQEFTKENLLQAARKLLHKGANISATSNDGYNPLKDAKLLKLLWSKHASLPSLKKAIILITEMDYKDYKDYKNSLDTLLELLKNTDSPGKALGEALISAAKHHNRAAIEEEIWLLSRDLDPSNQKTFDQALEKALLSTANNMSIDNNPNKKQYDPGYYTLELLLYGASKSSRIKAFEIIYNKGYESTLKLFAEFGLDVNALKQKSDVSDNKTKRPWLISSIVREYKNLANRTAASLRKPKKTRPK